MNSFNIFFNLKALQKAFQSPSQEGRKEPKSMIQAIIRDNSKRIKVKAQGMKGFIYEIVETLNTLKRFKELPLEIIWGDDCTICVYRDDDLIFWTGTTPDTWEASHLIDSLNKIDTEDSNFKITLLEAEE